MFIVLASGAPSVFRWYAGYMTEGEGGNFSLGGLSWIVVLSILFRIAAWMFFEVSGMWSAQGVFQSMIQGLSQTRTTFFDENPSGRIINRLIRDYDELRSTAIIFVGDLFNATIEILGIAVLACFASVWAGMMVVPLLLIFFLIHSQRSAMVEHSRSLAAVESSHVLNRTNDLIDGREIFILYGKAQHLLDRMTDSLRVFLRASILTAQIDNLASFWIRFSSELFSLVVLLFLMGALQMHQIDVPLAGVIISALFGMTGSIGWLDFASSLVSRSAPHLRRVFEFTDLPKEVLEEGFERKAEVLQEEGVLQDSSRREEVLAVPGDLVFENYSMSYRKDSPLILRDLNVVIRKGSKTAIIGRTGSGKSSIIQALFRMVYVRQGNIRIGGQSIFDMDLFSLRTQFGIVPQFPYLFEGTLRENLDRAGQKDDLTLLEALSCSGLRYPLDYWINEGGSNLSVGARQLICLARVIACNRSIILMDEPTSGLDPVTDARIHEILHTAFRDKTVLTIAHRKESLKYYDGIIEMKDGRVHRQP